MGTFRNIPVIRKSIVKILLVALVMVSPFVVKAQQEAMYTQYMENLSTINPAYAGSKDLLSMMVISRNQWVSLPNAPITRTFTIHSPVKQTNMGLGLSFLSDQVGPVKQTGLYFDYSYKLYFSNRRNLLLGLKGGVNFYEAGLSDLATNESGDPVFASDINRRFLPNVGVGAFFHADRYYLGLSVPKLIENTINREGVSTQSISKEQIHIFFMAGYVFDINRIVKFKPSILTKYVRNAPVSFDLNSMFLFYDKLWLGAMCRLGDSFGGLLQLQVTSQVKIGYSYDLTTSHLGAFSNGTHEIMVSYDFNLGRGKMRSPRYF